MAIPSGRRGKINGQSVLSGDDLDRAEPVKVPALAGAVAPEEYRPAGFAFQQVGRRDANVIANGDGKEIHRSGEPSGSEPIH